MGIKTIFKNTRRTFYRKKFQLLAIALIIFLSSCTYTAMFLATVSMTGPMDKMMEENRAEDFSVETIDFIMEEEFEQLDLSLLSDSFSYRLTELVKIDKEAYDKIIENRISEIKSNYDGVDYILQNRRYKEISFGDGFTVRAYEKSDNLNITYVEEGRYPETDYEIALNKTLAEKNDYAIGDDININGKNYEITGYIIYPDYTLPMPEGVFIIDPERMGVAAFNDEEFENIDGIEGFYLSGEFIDCTEKEFINEVIDRYKDEPISIVGSVVLTKNQMRSGAIYEEIRGGQATTLFLSLMIALIAVIMVAIVTFRMLNGERNAIGIMKSLGYKNYEIAIPYNLLLIFISLPMLIIGYLVGIPGAEYMKQLYLMIYMLPNVPVESDIAVMLTAIIVPFVFIIGLSYLIIKHMLNKKALSLLNVNEKDKATKLNKLINRLLKNAKAVTKFKYSYLTQSTGKFLVFVIGIFFASSLIIMSSMMYDFSDKMVNDYYESKDYGYEAYIDFEEELPEIENGQEKFLDAKLLYEEDNVNIKGIETDNKLFKLYDKHGDDITEELKNGVIINKAMKLEKNLDLGDSVKLEGVGKEKEFEVVGIENNNLAATMYMDIEELSVLISDDDTLYIGVYSTDIPKGNYETVLAKSDILEQAGKFENFILIAIYALLAMAVIIAVLILYILTTMTVEENLYSISLLKVMGYTQREIRIMILNSYFVYCVIAYMLALPVTVGMMNFFTKYLADAFNMYMPLEFNLPAAVVGLVIVVVIYLLGTINANRHIKNISLQEVLKAYRE